MTAPLLSEEEVIVYHHVPSLKAFKRIALVVLAVTLVPTLVITYLYPDTFWGAVPLFVTCLLLMQERFNLGKYAAWVTNKRVIFQGGEAVHLSDITDVRIRRDGVRLSTTKGAGIPKLTYPEDGPALAGVIDQARREAT